MDTTRTGLSMHWYALQTRSRHEQVVYRQLTEKRIEAFLPLTARWSHWKDRRKRIEWPLFPGYCFARFDLANRLPVLSCLGVSHIVSFAAVPASIPDSEIESLRLVLRQNVPCDPCPYISEGAFVQVIDGPMVGIVGRLLRKDAAHATVVLTVDLIGQAARVEVSADAIVPRRPEMPVARHEMAFRV